MGCRTSSQAKEPQPARGKKRASGDAVPVTNGSASKADDPSSNDNDVPMPVPELEEERPLPLSSDQCGVTQNDRAKNWDSPSKETGGPSPPKRVRADSDWRQDRPDSQPQKSAVGAAALIDVDVLVEQSATSAVAATAPIAAPVTPPLPGGRLPASPRGPSVANSGYAAQPVTATTAKPPAKGTASRRADTAPPPKSRPPRSPKPRGAPQGEQLARGDGGESWEVFLERASTHIERAGLSSDSAAALFEVFRTTDSLELTFAVFSRLFHVACSAQSSSQAPASAGAPWAPVASLAAQDRQRPWRFPYEPIRVALGGNWKAKQLWDKLDKRTGRAEYAEAPCAAGRLQGKRVVVIGAGPCGLRTAIELCLLGADVIVLERRSHFTRINQLHLWSWCGEDIKELGARCLEPPGQDFGSNPDLLTIGISDLQMLLLKTALLLGAEVLLGAEFDGVAWDQGWSVQTRLVDAGSSTAASAHVPNVDGAESKPRVATEANVPPPSPIAPPKLHGIAAIIISGGLGCVAAKTLNIETSEIGILRSEDAIGLVCNFAPTPSPDERSLRSFALARQFYGQAFKRLADTAGAELENIVYTKSKTSHYFIMTPKLSSLVACSVIRDAAYKPVMSRENIDKEALDTFVRRVVAFKFKEGEPSLVEAITAGGCQLSYADGGPMLFDFSKMRRAVEGLIFLPPPSQGNSGTNDQDLLVSVAGDALMEPFWPEGLGIVRGFFAGLDACSAIAMWSRGARHDDTQKHYTAAYTQLKTLGARTRGATLRAEEKNYALAPGSRYRAISND